MKAVKAVEEYSLDELKKEFKNVCNSCEFFELGTCNKNFRIKEIICNIQDEWILFNYVFIRKKGGCENFRPRCFNVKVIGLWKIVTQILATDHISYGSFAIKANSKEEALTKFNLYVVNEPYIYKANTQNVSQLEVIKI